MLLKGISEKPFASLKTNRIQSPDVSKIDAVLLLLLDGAWHDVSEMAHSLQIDYQRLERIIQLLAEFGFVETGKLKVRITTRTMKLLR